MQITDFQKSIISGIPEILPAPKPLDSAVSHAPVRKDILTPEEKKLALRNALRYFAPEHHAMLAPEFAGEWCETAIYMHRFRPEYKKCTPGRSVNTPQNRSRLPVLC